LFVAMGGVGYAALKLPRNSVGSKQIKANAVSSSKVANGALIPGDFKAGQFPAGAQGARGLQGAQGLKGDNGGTGPRGPRTLSFDGQFGRGTGFNYIATVNGIHVSILCRDAPDNKLFLQVWPAVADPGFHGWGTGWTGSALQHVAVSGVLGVEGVGVADLDVVAQASASGGKYMHFHVNGIVGNGCNYHALIVVPS
jgi:hypothetical protein